MRRQFTIELRVDFEDFAKNDVLRSACQRAARYVYATAMLLQDGIKPRIVITSDDIVSGHQQIVLMDTPMPEVDTLWKVEEEPVSNEMLTAIQENEMRWP